MILVLGRNAVESVAVSRDVTVQRELRMRTAQQAEELRALSLTDELTGLHNRRGFLVLGVQGLTRAHREKRKSLLFFIDLDGMKRINDDHGHNVGDQAIIDTGALLRQTLRASDVVARFGGDEFVAFADGDESAAAAFQERLQRRVQSHNEHAGRPYQLSLSVGVEVLPIGALDLERALAAADQRMYDMKRRDPNSRRRG